MEKKAFIASTAFAVIASAFAIIALLTQPVAVKLACGISAILIFAYAGYLIVDWTWGEKRRARSVKKARYYSKAELGVAEEAPSKESAESTGAVGYYFENIEEMIIFSQIHGEGKQVLWLKGDNYVDLYQKGYTLFENGKYLEAIEIQKESLAWNPIGLSARFEIVECYIQLNDFVSAKQALYAMTDYLISPSTLAKFYRRLGYILIEEKEFLNAAACYAYSSKFEDHPSLKQELLLARSKVEFDVGAILEDPTPVLNMFGSPILTTIKQ